LAFLASLGCACVPLLIRSQGEWTPLKLVVAGGAVLLAFFLGLFALGPAVWWQSAARLINAVRYAPTTEASPRASSWGRRLVVAAGVIAAAHLSWRLAHPDDPWDGDDQGTFLSTASEIANSGGPVQLIARLWSGEYAEANRHPLYTGLLSLRPTEEFGRILSALFAMLAWVAVVALTWQRFGPVQSGVAGMLTAVNSTWGYFGGMVVCESLLLLLSVVIWWQCLRLGDDRFGAEKKRTSRWVDPLMLGLLLGLNYLTKGTGVVLLGCVLIWFCWEGLIAWISPDKRSYLPAILRAAALTLLAFLLTASPLVARNMKRYGQPFYNDNTYLLFADQYEGFQELLARGEPVGQVARQYLATHSLADLARREASGLMWETFIIIRMLGPVPFDDARILCGVPLFALAVIGLLRAPPAHRRWLAVWFVIQWMVFAWYIAIAAGDRFVLALLPPLLVHAADGIVAAGNSRRGLATQRPKAVEDRT
jgi:4-amino-4-deoxy-L-arabinose transferase-like glycosyltransferase